MSARARAPRRALPRPHAHPADRPRRARRAHLRQRVQLLQSVATLATDDRAAARGLEARRGWRMRRGRGTIELAPCGVGANAVRPALAVLVVRDRALLRPLVVKRGDGDGVAPIREGGGGGRACGGGRAEADGGGAAAREAAAATARSVELTERVLVRLAVLAHRHGRRARTGEAVLGPGVRPWRAAGRGVRTTKSMWGGRYLLGNKTSMGDAEEEAPPPTELELKIGEIAAEMATKAAPINAKRALWEAQLANVDAELDTQIAQATAKRDTAIEAQEKLAAAAELTMLTAKKHARADVVMANLEDIDAQLYVLKLEQGRAEAAAKLALEPPEDE